MSPAERRLAKGEWVLVTGANGYIATHVVDVLLEEGYNVRGTVRAAKPWLNKFFDEKYGAGRFETQTVAALNEEGAFNEAIKGVGGVVHVATDTSMNPDPDAVISGVVAGTINLLEAAAGESSVKSVVLTSSSTAALIPEPNKEIVIDENTWNDSVVEAVHTRQAPPEFMPFMVYAASKTEQERAFFKWAKENKPGFAVNSVLPDMNIGKVLMPEGSTSTMGWVRGLLRGDGHMIKLTPPQYFIDVHDDARVHVAALLDPTVQNERLFAFAQVFNWTDIIGILTKLRPDNSQIPKPPVDEGHDITHVKGRKRAEELIKSFFGVAGWTGLEESVAAGIEDL
ncbi:hypothetical protein A1O7_00146 [Cladophialophora yegresii CBS 114405]|uniref:NAD-dependent epimerase/dehydratase domain-containing protein n=1 Tax=Cladophialophora yegresii CBS 114405 TaxID=1182544 RepID=W9WGT9_9EURO|nr:uncharacterized protein A1O7_00146 [Cladophialophora yegresii CBS 114405]EXJ63811.1 hypothetical protein A1O7_00146 [Cladophialophora yegresii CBS 114405]